METLLAEQGVVVLDGGLATELEATGHDLSDELWSARLLRDDPDAIRAVHRAYVEAGADCVITASYQATLERLPADALRLSVRLAREAAPRIVAASVGPYGAARADGSEYTGAYDLDEGGLRGQHAGKLDVLAESGADLLACETIPSFPEARALASLLGGRPAWFSFTCRDGERISDGTPIELCARHLDAFEEVVAIGVNCTPPRFVESLVRRIRTATKKPIVAYPNSGEHWDAARRRWTGTRDPGEFAKMALRWRDAGATILGGCCRTGPAHIRALRARLFP
ncbi:MAG TPA: homocysteine S-methyltransferase [Planctomycetota bacterium]|nr:homocysteine S-methyltransferase [Planctomycetota bacterium]